jgi:hypothetical protein
MRIVKCIVLLAFIVYVTGSCKKETVTIKEITHDTVIIKEVSPADLKKNKELHYGTWTFYQHEIEFYTAGALTSKKVETFTNYTINWKQDGTYSFNKNGTIVTGTWDLLSPGLFVYDKNDPVNERYYYIFHIDSSLYYRKGPYLKNGGLYGTSLATEFYKK